MNASKRSAIIASTWALVAIFLVPTADAVTLAGNLTPSSTENADSHWESYPGAENFRLLQSSTVDGLGFIFAYQDQTNPSIPAGTSALGSVEWFLYTDSDPADGVFGVPLATIVSGTASAASLSVTDLGDSPQSAVFNFFQVDFSIPATLLSAGDYWVGFLVNRSPGADQIFWQSASSGDGTSAWFDGDITSSWLTPYPASGVNVVFEVTGDVEGAVVPLPAALPLFATGCCFIGLAGWWRRRRSSGT